MEPRGNKDVLKFIHDFIEFAESCGISYEPLRLLFEAGYCYYFAYMLYHAFDRGEVCICAPYGHCVWKDTDGMIYDFHGVSDAEYEVLIPVKTPGSHEIDFKHVPTAEPGITKQQLDDLIKQVSEDLQK